MKLTALKNKHKTLTNEPDYYLYCWEDGKREKRGLMFVFTGKDQEVCFDVHLLGGDDSESDSDGSTNHIASGIRL